MDRLLLVYVADLSEKMTFHTAENSSVQKVLRSSKLFNADEVTEYGCFMSRAYETRTQ